MDSTLGGRLFQHRQALAMTLEEVGEYVGVSREAVRAWEGDEYKPKYDSLRKLAELYSTSVQELVND